MEKIIYALWRDEAESREAFNAKLLGPVARSIEPHARALRINVQDAAAAGGNSPRFVVTLPPIEAVAQIWVDTAYPPARAPIEAALASAASRVEGWLVSESSPLPNRLHPPKRGARTEGFSQMAFMERSDILDFATWQSNWQTHHTGTAIETQSTFEYVQNLVVRPLTEGARPFAAIVEECFPHRALADRALYYDAVGDPAKHEANEARMMASCDGFMGPAGCDCIPTSQYVLKSAWVEREDA